MTPFAVNLLLAGGWVAVSGSFDLVSLGLGYAAGFAALYVARGMFGPTDYFRRSTAVAGLLLYFLYDLVRSSIAVVREVLTPSTHSRPRLVEMPLDAKSDLEIMLTANLITLTPGTLTVDVAADRSSLLVHAMFAEAPEETIRDLKQGMERRVLDALR